MICPLKMITSTMQGETLAKECEEEKCAWWSKRDGECAVRAIAYYQKEKEE